MKKKLLLIGAIILLVIPIMVSENVNFLSTWLIVLFTSVHVFFFLYWPIFCLLKKQDKLKNFFIIRSILLLLLTTVFEGFAYVEVTLIFFVGIPCLFIALRKNLLNFNLSSNSTQNDENKCPNCGNIINKTDAFCQNCGVEIIKNIPQYESASTGKAVDLRNYGILNQTEDNIIKDIIKESLVANNKSENVTTKDIEKKKNIFTLIYAFITFILYCLYFFHTWVFIIILIEIIITIIFFKMVSKYSIYKYLTKEIKSRPDEKIDYIVASSLSGEIKNGIIFKILRVVIVTIAIIIPSIIFSKPHMIFEPYEQGYTLRFYTNGLFEKDTYLKIPDTYKGKPVLQIRGDVFKNVSSLEEVIIPDSIIEIRGGAFKNCIGLEKVTLSKNITEIKGNTFENNYSLKSIIIPDGVVRIGGSAFRNDYSLVSAIIPESVTEIGSSAFRNTALTNVCITKNAMVNTRAFKETNVIIKYYEDNCERIPVDYN